MEQKKKQMKNHLHRYRYHPRRCRNWFIHQNIFYIVRLSYYSSTSPGPSQPYVFCSIETVPRRSWSSSRVRARTRHSIVAVVVGPFALAICGVAGNVAICGNAGNQPFRHRCRGPSHQHSRPSVLLAAPAPQTCRKHPPYNRRRCRRPFCYNFCQRHRRCSNCHNLSQSDCRTDGQTEDRAFGRSGGHTVGRKDGQTAGRITSQTHGWAGGRMDRRTGRRTVGRMVGRTDSRTDSQTDNRTAKIPKAN